ncbi:CGNR zinc finger domain-containing protein [Actinomadura sp. NEAU-AAG7]|uniref:CGNR zinc finger domain-containing protein n=1 Tax=Actinomadura sp. NEAU-AAG7 TaxID=2839640 RepID=UPI001BE4982D|nr:CGNR zinc finger domain-containing protein [Actinomadura sp. NEAU-AAG7]MBT2213263.1 CGNR zinc finger domain-containing protein [Actinomadura sp. NEAU-AAG7]
MGDGGRGFRPVERLVELANAVREDPALPAEAIAGMLVRHGESPEDVTGAAFTAGDARDLRAAVVRLTGVLTETDPDRAAEAVNDLLTECGARPRLSRHDGHPWHLHVDRGDDASWADWLLASSALALAQLFSEAGRPAWGECAASGCSRVFAGTGTGAARRHCSPACASRERVAAHRRRRGAR